MNDLEKRIFELQQISKELEPSEDQRNQFITQINHYTNHFISGLENNGTYSSAKEGSDVFAVNNEKKSLEDILKMYAEEVVAKGIKPASGGHLGYIPGGGIYTAAIADYLADITNEYAGIYYASPGAVSIENELLNWMKSIFGFPETAVGNLTSGGSIANLIALTAARDHHQIKSNNITNSVIYLSQQVHHSATKALRIIGLEDIIIRFIDLDSNSKMLPSDLNVKVEKDKKAGLNPFLVIASAGTTDTGAIDPLQEIGEITKSNNLWYHVDAAYGGFFILTKQKKEHFKGIELADSLIVDPHKGLFIPYGLGAVLVKNKTAVYHSHHLSANYMQDAITENATISPADVSPELTKHFRGLRLWLPLQLHGIKPFVACLQEKLLLTAYFRTCLQNIGFKLGPEPDLSVSYFWYPVKEGQENEFNEKLMKEIHKDGEIFLSSTSINGKFVIRMAILSFRTKLHTINRAVSMIDKARQTVEHYLI